MKDKQITSASAEPRIFFVSAFLHCVSMTMLVYLRFSFGYSYLRPKSVFFAFSWAFVLYAVYAWIEGTVWYEYRMVLIFGLGAVALYGIHLVTAIVREWRQNGSHDNYSGSSHPFVLIRHLGRIFPRFTEAHFRLWGEPGFALVLSLSIRLFFGEWHLTAWLAFVAACLWSKELLNHWFQIRHRKRQDDMFEDTTETIDPPTASNLSPEAPKAIRKPKLKRVRSQG